MNAHIQPQDSLTSLRMIECDLENKRYFTKLHQNIATE